MEVRELPDDLARLDVLLGDPVLLAPIIEGWEASARDRGRPTIAMALFVRLMVVKQRCGWGYETFVKEVSDSFDLRRFVGLSVTASVPHESTIRKLAGRLGPEVVEEITRALIDKAIRERRFSARAMRVDSTVVESDVRWPSDAALALDGIRRLAREGARLEGLIGDGAQHVQDRSRAAGRRLRLIGRTVGRRLGGPAARASRSSSSPARPGSWSPARSARRAGWPPRHARRRGAAARSASSRRLSAWSARPTWQRRSRGRSLSVWPGRRSSIGWSRSPTRTPGRSAKASWASVTSSAMSSSSPS